MYHLPWTATTSSNARKQTVKKKKKAERQPLFITTSPQWGLRFFQTGALLPMTQSEVSTGIFLVKQKARGAGCTLQEGPAPRDCGWGLVGVWVQSPSHRWLGLSSERKEDTCWQINLKAKIACEAITHGNPTYRSQRESWKRQEGCELRQTRHFSSYSPEPEAKCPWSCQETGTSTWKERLGK